MSDTPEPVEQAANEGADTRPDAPSFGEDAQMVVSVQISQRLHPQLFDDLARARKRERAERLRWLCQYGLAAERQALTHAHAASVDDARAVQQAFAQSTQHRESRLPQPQFALPLIDPFDVCTDNARSVVSHPDINHLLL